VTSRVDAAPEKGDHTQVTDFRPHRASANTMNTPNFFCVRLVWNGDWIHQLCDPGDGATPPRLTGVVRQAIEELWNDLKRAHWIDHATRAMTLTMHLSSNNAGVRSRVTFMFEFTAAGSVLPSYDVQVRAATRPWHPAPSHHATRVRRPRRPSCCAAKSRMLGALTPLDGALVALMPFRRA
jgi:hypothetical protein